MNLTMEEALDLCEIEHPGKIPGHIHCPFHDEATPSLAVWEDHYHCFGCGQGGSAFDFVAQRLAGGNYKLAFQFIIRAIDVDELESRPVRKKEPEVVDLTEKFYREVMQFHDDAENLFKTKWPHLSVAFVMDEFSLGAGRYNLLVPHFDKDERIVGVKTRSLMPAKLGEKSAFPGSTFTSQLYTAAEPGGGDLAYLVEGESDTWTLTQHFQADERVDVYGLPSGAMCWKPHFAEQLARYERVVLYLDSDETGVRAARRIAEDVYDANKQTVIVRTVPGSFKDVTEAYIAGWRP